MKNPVPCRTIREGLTEYLEDALSGATRQSFDEHLSACPECRRLLDEVRAVITNMQHLHREKMPGRMKDVIKRALPVRDVSQ